MISGYWHKTFLQCICISSIIVYFPIIYPSLLDIRSCFRMIPHLRKYELIHGQSIDAAHQFALQFLHQVEQMQVLLCIIIIPVTGHLFHRLNIPDQPDFRCIQYYEVCHEAPHKGCYRPQNPVGFCPVLSLPPELHAKISLVIGLNIMITFQPAFINFSFISLSRSTFLVIFSFQKSALFSGHLKYRHPSL